MFPSKLSVLQSEYGDRLRVASMAAITKPDGGIRPSHDGAHSVRVNNDIIYRDRTQCPGPPEVAAVVRECSQSREAPFAVAADIKSAHRLVKIRSQDWGEFQTFARNCLGLGALATIAEISTLKRLVFESHTMLLAQLREQVSNPQASASRPLPAVEREAKLRDLRARLGGVVIEQQLEPSHPLIDLFSQQWEAKQLEYVSPEKCTSREWEIMRGKSNKHISLDNEKLLIKEEKSVPDQPVTSSELLILDGVR